jgi:histone H3
MPRTKQVVQRNLAAHAAASKGIPAHAAGKGASPPKPHRFRPGTVALREIRKYQKTTDNLIPRAPLMRLVREIMNYVTTTENGVRITKGAFEALRDGAEDMLVDLFETTQIFALHRNCITIQPKDMQLVISQCIDRTVAPSNKMGLPKRMTPH